MKYNTVIFDLDGTLLDTLEDLMNAANHALGTFQLPAVNLEQMRRYIGNGVRNLMLRCVYGMEFTEIFGDVKNAPEDAMPVPADVFEEILSAFMEYYRQHLNVFTKPYPGIPELLKQLKAAGCRMGMVSNKFDAATKELCREHFGDDLEIVFGQREGVPKKPAPDAVFEVMEHLGAEPSRTVYVGDSAVDLKTARNAGLDGILCSWGFTGREKLTAILEAEGSVRQDPDPAGNTSAGEKDLPPVNFSKGRAEVLVDNTEDIRRIVLGE